MIGIIFNPASGKGRNKDRMANVRGILDENGFEYGYRETECPDDGIRVSKELSHTCDVLIAAGGDGTLHEVLNGALESGVSKIGVLPFGSGNDVARSMGVFDKTDEELAGMIMNPRFARMDAGVSDGRPFIQFLTFGIVSNIIRAYADLESAGQSGYRKALVRTLIRQKPRHYVVEIPGEEPIDCMADYLAVQNVQYAGAGLPIHPGADSDDNRMDLIIVRRRSMFRYLLNVVALVRGKLTSQPNTVVIPVTRCRIVPEASDVGVLDGELFDMDEANMEMRDQIDFLVC